MSLADFVVPIIRKWASLPLKKQRGTLEEALTGQIITGVITESPYFYFRIRDKGALRIEPRLGFTWGFMMEYNPPTWWITFPPSGLRVDHVHWYAYHNRSALRLQCTSAFGQTNLKLVASRKGRWRLEFPGHAAAMPLAA